ncbi:hypothetical protein SB748_34415, partial [Rhizobium sp. SIMBA_035]
MRFNGVENDLRIATELALTADDLKRFSEIAGLSLSGSAIADITGHFQLLSGAFGVDLALTGQDLGTGIADVDPLLTG